MLRSFSRFPILLNSKLKTLAKYSQEVPLFFFRQSETLSTYCPTRNIKTSISLSVEMDFTAEKDKYLNLSLQDKRSQYHCKSNFVTLEKIPTWTEYSSKVEIHKDSACSKDDDLNEKVSIFVGDITSLEIDAIVNAANSSLRGGGGVDGAIHRAAGKSLLSECITLKGCDSGDAKITGGYKLPAKYIIHTVGPMGEHPDVLKSCYLKSLTVAKDNGVRSVAFPCISTGIYGYPNKPACQVALKTVREFLEKNRSSIDRVIFCLFLPVDVELYEKFMPHFFPV